MENKRKKRSVQNKGQERRGRYCSSYYRKYIEQSRAEQRRGEREIFFLKFTFVVNYFFIVFVHFI